MLVVAISLIFVLVSRNGKNMRYTLETLPTKENPSPTGLYSNVPPFEKWEWREGYDDEGKLVYRIKLPPIVSFTTGVDSYKNNLDIFFLERERWLSDEGLLNEGRDILEFYNNSEQLFEGKKTKQITNYALSKYHSHRQYIYFYTPPIEEYWILTKKNLIFISIDSGLGCLGGGGGYNDRDIDLCKEYFSIYLPIVDKVISTLEIPDYVDNRGFVPENEQKTLTEQFFAGFEE